MTDKPITTVSELIVWTKDLVGSFLLYRGLGDVTWKAEESAAYRRVENSQKDNVSDLAVQEYIERLLNEASSAGFRDAEGKKLSDLELLAKLQHHGAATCLIDFTANALIALWFACREKPDKPGKVVAMETGNPDYFSIIGYQDLLDKRIGGFLKENKLWKYKPSSMDNRFIAQQSVFVFGQWDIEKRLHEITIDKNSKQQIRAELKKSFAITEEYLFSDFTGFALSNACDKTLEHNVYTANDYFEMGVRLQQRKDYRNAIENYNKVIEFDPQFVDAYYNRGVTKIALENYLGAIEDFKKVVELDPNHLTAHGYIGIAKDALGDPSSVEEFKKQKAILEIFIAEKEKQGSRK